MPRDVAASEPFCTTRFGLVESTSRTAQRNSARGRASVEWPKQLASAKVRKQVKTPTKNSFLN
jgi:hypothetical protein